MQLAEHSAGALAAGHLCGRRGEVLLDDGPHGAAAAAAIAACAAGRSNLLGRTCATGDDLFDGRAGRTGAETHVHQGIPLIAGHLDSTLLVQTNLS